VAKMWFALATYLLERVGGVEIVLSGDPLPSGEVQRSYCPLRGGHCVCVRAHTYTYIHACTRHVHMPAHAYIYIHKHMHTHIRMCVCVCVLCGLCVCVCVHTQAAMIICNHRTRIDWMFMWSALATQ
jgi:hypothetical protein